MRNFFVGKQKKKYLLIVWTVALFACHTNSKKQDKKQKIVPSKERLINYIRELEESKYVKSTKIKFQIDSIAIQGEVEVIDSLNQSIYLGITPNSNEKLFGEIQGYFNKKYRTNPCKKTFCSWKKQFSKKDITEVFLTDETSEKKFPYLVLEIEKRHD